MIYSLQLHQCCVNSRFEEKIAGEKNQVLYKEYLRIYYNRFNAKFLSDNLYESFLKLSALSIDLNKSNLPPTTYVLS